MPNLPTDNPDLDSFVVVESPQKLHPRKIFFIISVLLLIAGGVGFYLFQSNFSLPFINSDKTPVKASKPSVAPIKNESKPAAETSKNELVIAHNTFGFNVLGHLKTQENVFISPMSLSLALSMVYNGANGETQQAMAKTLQLEGIDITKINAKSLELMNLLQNPDPKVEIDIANSIWTNQQLVFNKNFLDVNKQFYKAQISSLDFGDPKSVDIINSWVSESTKGKIPSIVDEVKVEDLMFLLNAVYFKGSWATEFDKTLTHDGDFNLADGATKKVQMMKQVKNLPYLENDLFQAASLPYGENKRLSMYIFLPKGDFLDFMNGIDIKQWQIWQTEFKETEGTIILPKFKMEYRGDFKDLLSNLGMGVAFSNSANFQGMKNDVNDPDPKISEVVQKTYIEVNEEGTEAAAVTEIGMVGTTSLGPEVKTFYMEVNKPFYFMIVDNQTSEVLFMGFLNNPQ